MKDVNSNTFTTDLCRRVTVQNIDGGTFLTVASTISDEYIDVTLDDADTAALASMLNGEELTPPAPEFKAGDLVRHDGTGTLAEAGSLARVTTAPRILSWADRKVMGVEWLDSRAKNQAHGGYYVKSFSLVDKASLTVTDLQSILERVLDSNC